MSAFVDAAAEEIDEELERAHFRTVVTAFKYYKLCSLQRIHKSENIISMLPQNHHRLLEKYRSYLNKFKQCLDANNIVVLLIIRDVGTMFQNAGPIVPYCDQNDTNGPENFGFNYNNFQLTDQLQHVMKPDVEKVQSVLKNIVRDWSEAGAAEREQCYKPILDELDSRFPAEEFSDRSEIKVLVPGAGLGRLAWEVAAKGYCCQGNEFSLFMLFASNFILNKCPEANKHTVYPWVHQYVNHLTCEHQVQPATFPDVPPTTNQSHFSMAAGDFLKVYTQLDEWDCVATCFFIDCAPNVIEFIERIYFILKPGGFWINLGPLLYHYSDMPTECSIEPPYDILVDIIRNVGFEILKQKTGVKTKYAQNPNSMMQHEYNSVFFVCRKPDLI